MTWQEALQFANGSGAAVIAGVLISVLIEYWPWFQAQEQKHKVLAYVVLCLFIPFLAAAASIATGAGGAWGDVAGTWWPAAFNGLTAAGLGTLFHAWAPQPLRA